MRRKLFLFTTIMLMAMILSACGNDDSKVSQVIQNQIQETSKENGQIEQAKENEGNKFSDTSEKLKTEVINDDNTEERVSDGDVDVDLTKLSSTMVYAEVYNMMIVPEMYIGKIVKMRGMFVAYTEQDLSQFYPAVIIADATACCSQGLEFVLEGNPSYPEGYPEMETDITVIGTFETYVEDGNTYCRLQNAKIE